MAQVIRLLNPQGLDVPTIDELFARALPEGNLSVTDGYAKHKETFRQMILNPNEIFLLGVEDGAFKGLIWGSLPEGIMMTKPQIMVTYNEGSIALKGAMIKFGLDLLLQLGYTKFIGLNATGKADLIWLRTFKDIGKGEKVGSIFEFTIG